MKTKILFIMMAIFSLITNSQTVQQSKVVTDGNHQYYNVDELKTLSKTNYIKQDFISNQTSLNETVLFDLFKFQNTDSLVMIKNREDAFGSRLIEYEQYRNLVKVYQSSIKILYDVNGKLTSISGNWFSAKSDILQFLNNRNSVEDFVYRKKNKSDLLIYNLNKIKPAINLKTDIAPKFQRVFNITKQGLRPQWKVDLYFYDKESVSLIIDDKTKSIVSEISLDNHCDNSTVSTPHNGNRSFKSTLSSGTYYSTNSCDGYSIAGFDNQGNNHTNTSEALLYTSPNSSFNSTSEIIGATTVWMMSEFNNYLASEFNRNSYDDNGGNWISINNTLFNGNGNNASFNSGTGFFSFGRGSSNSLDDDYNTIDIVGHEVSHAIDHSESNLAYQNESGAIDESFADILGEILEWIILGDADWLHGEDIGTNRSLINPHDHNDPSVYEGNDWYFGNGDNGGVHTNSGVQNHFFYLLTEGGAGNNEGNTYDINGIGMDNASKLAYKVLTDLVSSNTDYYDVRNLWLSAASSLFPSNSSIYNSVRDAWCACGIGGADCSSGGGSPSLSFHSVDIDDDNSGSSNGNDNGQMEGGETGELNVFIFNGGDADANNVDVLLELASPNQFITIPDNDRFYGTIEAGEIDDSPDFDITVTADAPTMTVDFILTMTSDEGTFTDTFTITIFGTGGGSPSLSFHSVDIDDDNSGSSNGNDNGQMEGGETGELNVFIFNGGDADANNVDVLLELASPNQFITIPDNDRFYSTIEAGEIDDSPDFDITITADAPTMTVDFILTMASDEGTFTDTFTITILGTGGGGCDVPEVINAYNITTTVAHIEVEEISEGVEYNLVVRDPSGIIVYDSSSQAHNFQVNNLEPNTTYNCKAKVRCVSEGWGEYGNNFYFTTEEILGTENIIKEELKIYPNPTLGILYFSGDMSNIDKVTISDVTGKVLLQKNSAEKISIEMHPTGLYFVSITLYDGNAKVYKVIKI
ncbi:M4 family metallopeptidase [Patiriisocius marinus]|uniref:M4 family metallopeptidase n=1 Tax=Patiriisocius marinus TaxID=1397112 RepID=UPI00232EFFD9|nr:M4 family metallopeptidase [Patiriisocius marinus]